MFTNATAPDVGAGPYGVEHDPEGGFYLTLDGVRTGKVYYVGKTAYRTARVKNLEGTLTALPYLEDAPEQKVTASPATGGDAGAGDAPVAPKASKGRKARPDARVTPDVPAPKKRKGPKVEPKFTTRDEWLNAFVVEARPIFKAAGLDLPEKIRVSVGWMFRSSNKKTLGQCWHEEASTDGTREIWINPTLDGGTDSSRIADVVTHELCHTLFGKDEKHGRHFKEAVGKLGLEGKATATIAGPDWHAWADPILEKLGPLPHAALDPTLSGVKKQKTYLIKAQCDTCDCPVRVTAKWVNKISEAGERLACIDGGCDGTLVVEGDEGGEGE